MRPFKPGNDATFRGRRRGAWPLVVAVLCGLGIAGAGGYWLLRPHHPSAPIAALVAPIEIRQATESEISQHVATRLTVFRFTQQPRILVLDFPSLHDQAQMLNRVAAFVEKSGLPHDRVLSDSELSEAIERRGESADTFYLGHDYPAASLARFFLLADGERIDINPAEQELRRLLRQEGWLAEGVNAALISVPAAGSDPRITGSVRETILRHELSHGEFFSNPAYAEYVHRFWLTELTEEERRAVRDFLSREGYDPGDEELMYNEMQAYLMFTRDPLFFTPNLVGMTPERLWGLQNHFLSGMPPGWLRDLLGTYAGATSTQ